MPRSLDQTAYNLLPDWEAYRTEFRGWLGPLACVASADLGTRTIVT